MSREVLEVVKEEKEQAGKREVRVQVRRVRITPQKGDPFTVVDACIFVGRYDFHMSVPEASAATRLLSRLLPEAHGADEKQKTWERRKRKERDQYRPGPSDRQQERNERGGRGGRR